MIQAPEVKCKGCGRVGRSVAGVAVEEYPLRGIHCSYCGSTAYMDWWPADRAKAANAEKNADAGVFAVIFLVVVLGSFSLMLCFGKDEGKGETVKVEQEK